MFNLAADMGGMGAFVLCCVVFCVAWRRVFFLHTHTHTHTHSHKLNSTNTITFPSINKGFIQSNHSVILYNNTMVSYSMLEAARLAGVTR